MTRNTLLTSRRSQADFIARLVFFVAAPLGIVPIALLFPVTGTLLSVAAALVVFAAREWVSALAGRSWIVRRLVSRELLLTQFYLEHPPKPFVYYVFYPLLFPYWLFHRQARQEFLFFKGYTIVGAIILLASVVVQYVRYWPPELGLRSFLPVVAITLAAEALLVLSLLMPLATTVIGFHQTRRRGRLMALLLIGLLSTSVGLVRVLQRRDPVISFAARYRVRLRTKAASERAQAAQRAAVKVAWRELHEHPRSVEGDGKVEGEPLDKARAVLGQFYKEDESDSFDLWASPRYKPTVLVLYSEARRNVPALWIAIREGQEVHEPRLLPRGAFKAMREAAEQ